MSILDGLDEPSRPNARERVQTALQEYAAQQRARRNLSTCSVATSGDHVRFTSKERGLMCVLCLRLLNEDGSERT